MIDLKIMVRLALISTNPVMAAFHFEPWFIRILVAILSFSRQSAVEHIFNRPIVRVVLNATLYSFQALFSFLNCLFVVAWRLIYFKARFYLLSVGMEFLSLCGRLIL